MVPTKVYYVINTVTCHVVKTFVSYDRAISFCKKGLIYTIQQRDMIKLPLSKLPLHSNFKLSPCGQFFSKDEIITRFNYEFCWIYSLEDHTLQMCIPSDTIVYASK